MRLSAILYTVLLKKTNKKAANRVISVLRGVNFNFETLPEVDGGNRGQDINIHFPNVNGT